MNILILDSWLREFLETKATPKKIAQCLSLCGPSVERLTKFANDWIYDIEITTNRVDLMSTIGIAEEASAILPQFGIKAKFNDLTLKEIKAHRIKKLPLEISDPEKLCNRVLGIIIDEVKIGPSPLYIQKRLIAAGVRSLNNLIDITNYVMLETGHPAHVFDYDRLHPKKLIFRKARKGEKLISLDNKTYTLLGGDIVIDNSKGEIIDLPGIMGTANSVVTAKTKRVLFFIDNCDPVQIRKTSMTQGIRTFAATINEKAVNCELGKTALLRGIELYHKFAHGVPVSQIYDLYPKPLKNKKIIIEIDYLQKILGINIQSEKIIAILNSLAITSKLNPKNNKQISCQIPFWRMNDLNQPSDIVEEVARIYGYHNLPSVLMCGSLPERSTNLTKQFLLEEKTKQYLSNWGYTETYTYSMQAKEDLLKSGLEPSKHLKITNPLSSDWEYLRTSLIPSLLKTVKFNLNQNKNLNFFELSNIYLPKKKVQPEEKPVLTILCTGENQFSYLKGLLEELFFRVGLKKFSFTQDDTVFAYYQPKNTLTVKSENNLLGSLGLIDPKILYNWSLTTQVTACEIDFNQFIQAASLNKTYTPIPVYPAIIEDLSFNLTGKISLGQLLTTIKAVSNLIVKTEVLDQYKEHITFRITYQDLLKPLTNTEIAPLRNNIIKAIETKYSAKLIGKIV